ncbi:hypothetical protein [Algibacter sp. 2305UL17-15]|uniref:hypothetical protein n=1 Tax=Algibacter sp. 2305UL17-15 TaxID=3231268 RepID=UPI0034589562
MSKKVINLFDNKVTYQNEGVKYSVLIDKFVAPFENDFPKDFYVEDIFEFAINAWNFGNMRLLIPVDEFEQVIASVKNQGVDFELLEKMIAYKVSNFKEYHNFISDFEITDVNGVPTLTVIAENEDSYLQNMMTSQLAHEPSQEDFEENYINRYAIILKPKQPFFDWINNLYPDDKVIEVDEANIYLVDNNVDDLAKWLRKKFDKFFTIELNDWHTNKKEWPQKRNFKLFNQWFHVDISTMVYDMEKQPISKNLEIF